MEGESSRPPPPPPKEFDSPWKQTPWQNKKIFEDKLRKFKPSNPNAKFVRILVVGEVGAGKSSFINSVNNVFQGQITCLALVHVDATTGTTTRYKTHYIDGKDDSPLPFVFNDIMGLESNEGGVLVEDLIKALEGFVKEGYKFNPACALDSNDHGYESNPTLDDQTCCLVNIIAADKVSRMSDGVIEKMKRIREKACELGMPQVIIMTRVDEACPLVKEDLRKIYTSKKIKEKMQICSNLVGIPMNHIFAVKNYHKEIDTVDDMDVLILKALDQVVSIANDKQKQKHSTRKIFRICSTQHFGSAGAVFKVLYK